MKVFDTTYSGYCTANSGSQLAAPKEAMEMMGEQKHFLVYEAHVFYYAWYGNPETDGDYKHWNHEIIPDPFAPKRVVGTV